MAGKYNKHKHLGFPIRTISATVDLQVTLILTIDFESIALLVQEKKFKIDFQDGHLGRHLGFPIRTISAISDLQVTNDASYQVSSPVAFRFRRRSEK